MYSKLIIYLQSNHIDYEIDVDLKKRTWIHRGGVCDVFISPINKTQLIKVVQYLYSNKLTFIVVGYTSNIYILNSCNIPIVVSTKKYNEYKLYSDRLYCDAGVNVMHLAKHMVENGIIGFEYLTDLPGTVASAIYNNSSCETNSISQLLISAEVLLDDGNLITMYPEDFSFGYRTSKMKKKEVRGVIISVLLRTEKGDLNKLQNISQSNIAKRRKLLKSYAKTLGSTMNCCFSNGRMPLHLYFPFRIYNFWLKVVEKDAYKRQQRSKDFICKISGYKEIANYISDEDIIIFIWRDENADDIFPKYLEFMKKVYRTQMLEIEIIKD